MFWFSLASLSPLALLICACLWAGIWPGVALAYMILCVYALDRLGRRKLPVQQDAQTMHRADLLSVTLALGHLGLLPALMIAIPQMPMLQAVLTGAAAGLFMGQVSHPNAHELIHRPARGLRRLGAIVCWCITCTLARNEIPIPPILVWGSTASGPGPGSGPSGPGGRLKRRGG